jgi:dynein heavy chain
LYEKRKELGDSANKLSSGLSKIVDTRVKVEQLSIQLEENKAKAARFQKECEDYLVVLVGQKREADEQAKVIISIIKNVMENKVVDYMFII